MNGPRIISPLQNPESTVGAAFLQFGKRFSAAAVLGLLFSAAPRLLLIFLDQLPGIYRIDLYSLLLSRIRDEAVLTALETSMGEYAKLGLFSVSPLYLVVAALVTLALTPLLNGCAARLAIGGFLGEEKDTMEILAEGRSRYGRLVGTSLCAILATVVIYVVAALPMVLATLFTATKLGVGVLGMLAFVCAFVFWVAASFAALCLAGMHAAVVMEEGLSGLRALARTWKLARVRFGRNAWALLLASLLTSYCTLAVQSLFLSASVHLGNAAGALVGGVLATILPLTGARCYIASRSRAAWQTPMQDGPQRPEEPLNLGEGEQHPDLRV